MYRCIDIIIERSCSVFNAKPVSVYKYTYTYTGGQYDLFPKKKPTRLDRHLVAATVRVINPASSLLVDGTWSKFKKPKNKIK